MPIIVDQVDPALFQQPPPRPLPPMLLPNLLGEYLIETPLHAYFDLVLISGFVGGVAMVILDVGPLLWVLLGLIMATRLGMLAWKLGRQVREDMALIKYGMITWAYILHVRPRCDELGHPAGCYLDCAIPVGQRCTSVGSVWLADSAEARRLGQQGRVRVICLVRPPGTWRLLEVKGLEAFRYEPLSDETWE